MTPIPLTTQCDHSIPADEVHVIDSNGNIVGKIVNIGPEDIPNIMQTWFESQGGPSFASFWKEAFNASAKTAAAVAAAQEVPDEEFRQVIKGILGDEIHGEEFPSEVRAERRIIHALRSAGMKVVRA
jgi:hypothetical protein